MNTDFNNMKKIFLQVLNGHLKDISIPFKMDKIEERKTSHGHSILNVAIAFPGAYSDLRVYAINEYTFGIGVVVKEKNGKNHFSIVDYLAYKNIPGENKFVFDVHNVNCADGFDATLTYFVSLCNTSLKNVLLGKVWEDIPFDWSNYK